MNHTRQTAKAAIVLLLVSGCAATRHGHGFEPRPPVAGTGPQAAAPEEAPAPAKQLFFTFTRTQGATPIWTLAGRDGFFFTAGMTINADGAPNAYHPEKTKGLDFLGNAGHSGNWWGLATDNGKPSGKPLVQQEGEFKGFYVSQTALYDHTKVDGDLAKYVDAREIPFLVLPPQLLGPGLARMGDLAVVYNTRNGALDFAVIADQGPRDTIGEGSIALAANLDINTDMRNHTAGQDGGVVYLVLPGTAAEPPWPRTLDDIRASAAATFEAWGGLEQLKAVVDQ